MMNQLKMFFCSVKENFLGDDNKGKSMGSNIQSTDT